MGSGLKAGAATANITPPLGVSIPGSFRPRFAQDVHDEMLAKALVIENGETQIAMVTCDLVAMPQEIGDAVKSRILERCGIPPEHVMVNATHSHTGPNVVEFVFINKDEDYSAWVPLKIADAVELALRRMKPARVGFASASEDRISFHRRWRMTDGTVRMNPGVGNPELDGPAGPIDPEVAMMYVEGSDGKPISAVANFSLHYVGTDDGEAISADYYGHFYRLMRHYIGGVPILWNAASGQINNHDYSGRTTWQDRGHRQAERMANVLAGHVITEIQLMEMHESLELGGAMATLEYPRKAITEEDLKTAEAILAAPEGAHEGYDSGPFSFVVGQPIPKNLVYAYAQQCPALAKLPERMTAPVQVLRLGDAAVAALPGEVFVEIGLRLKSNAAATPLFIASLANGYIGYIATDDALTAQGGYETWASLWALGGVGTAPAMEELTLELMEELWRAC